MAKAKEKAPVVETATETEEIATETTVETTTQTPAKPAAKKSETTDWKKAAVIAVLSAIGLYLLFGKKHGEKAAPKAPENTSDTSKPSSDRFGSLRKL